MRSFRLILLGVAIGFLMAMPFRWRRGASMPQLSIGDSLAERELNRIVQAVDIEDMPFDRAIAEIQKLTPAKIAVDWKALREIGYDRQARVSIHGSGMILRQVIGRLIDVGSMQTDRTYPLAYEPRGGRIVIAPAKELSGHVFARLYDVRDLISDVEASDSQAISQELPPQFPPHADGIARMLEETVVPESWHEMGGNVGTIFDVGDHLYIVQTWANHRLIEDLLRTLRSRDAAPPTPLVEQAWSDVHQTWASKDVPQALETLICRPIDRIDFVGVPLDEAINKLRKLSRVNIWVNWAALADAKLSRRSPVSLQATNASLSWALNALLAHPMDGVLLGFAVENGVVEISTREETDRAVLTRLYDVRDFLMRAAPADRGLIVYDLGQIVCEKIAPDSWRDGGGTIGQLLEMNGYLLVTQTWANHERIAAILDALRHSGYGLVPVTHHGSPSR